jgi:diaminobutyrate-2-oxoglutarate transaminase
MRTVDIKHESNVNSYARLFPATFEYAEGDRVTDRTGKTYLDFFCGAGALNYGHNHPQLKKALIKFIEQNSIVHCLDMDSKIKEEFLDRFWTNILEPRGFDYKIQFTGPTGTNAVEAAVKLARKITNRKKIISFTNSFHGMTATSLALSGILKERHNVNPSQDVIFFPFDNFMGKKINTLDYMKKMINGKGSGIETPAAIILETVQAEGGVNIAGNEWLKEIREFATENGIILIVDEIQTGCGRTGTFFSFERANILPDIVLLSKSISGFGLPLSIVLIKPDLDTWLPGEHNGTFRSNNLALCTANESLKFWNGNELETQTLKKAEIIKESLEVLKTKSSNIKDVRGIGFIWGIEFKDPQIAQQLGTELFNAGMIIEVCGCEDNTLKLLPPLTISEANLKIGLEMIVAAVLKKEQTLNN